MLRRVWVIGMFESYFERFLDFGVLGNAFQNKRKISIKFEFNSVSLPLYSAKGFKGVDASPFGGGPGMIMRSDILKNALMEGVVKAGGYDEKKFKDELHIVCPAPRGKTWDQDYAQEFATSHFSGESSKDLVFICGRYEGIDERFLEGYVDEFISLGDYILTGGELAVMVILDTSMRFVSGVLGNECSALEESFLNNRLEHALYTKPQDFEGKTVPSELVLGHHKKIREFKESSSLEMTLKYRPDLLKKKN